MFDFVRRHNRILQFALVLLIFPSFVLFGIQGYQRFSEQNAEAAKVAGRSISQAELESAYREQIERVRAQMPNVDVKMFDTPEMRQRVLEDLVRQRVTQEAAFKLMLTPTDEQLVRIFQTDPQFANLRNADGTVRKELLAARGLTSEQFAQQLKLDLAVRQVFQGIGASVPASEQVAMQAMNALFQQREIQVLRFSGKDQLARVTLTEADLQAYYEDPTHATMFQTAEQAQVDYVVLDLEAVTRSIRVSDDELRKYYDENKARYAQPEERRARHILVKADKGASAEEKSQARSKAEALLATVRKNPAGFADVARKQSDDPGSATQGGDLDWFGRGAMTKPFEDAVFALKKGEISTVVETDFGFHVIELTDVRGGQTRSFDSVRADLEAEVRKQLAQKKFAESAEQFTDAVEQDDKLQAVAEKLKLEVHRIDGVSRQALPTAQGPLAQPKVLEALFAPDVVAGKRNTGAIEIGANQLVAAHVVKHTPARKQDLTEVKDLIRQRLGAQRASELARKEGAERLAALQKTDNANWPAAVPVSRVKAGDLPRAIVDAALRAPADKLPRLTGVDLGDDGYAVIKVTKVLGADPTVAGEPAKVREQFAQLWGQAESEAYYRALKTRYGVTVSNKSDTKAASTP